MGQLGYYYDDEGFNASTTSPPLPLYVRARFYWPAVARWLNPDPIGILQGDSNLYRYVANNPVNRIDPSGLLVPAVLAGLALAVAACAYPFHEYAHNHFPDSTDKFKHCWVSGQMSRACTGILAQYAGLGKEVLDALKPLIGEKYPGLEDSLDDLIANQQCIHWESYIPILNFCGYFRESVYDCCKREVGY